LEAEECSIYWLHPGQPPLHISEGYGAGMGSVDRTEAFFRTHLENCRSSADSANYKRIILMLKQKKNACCVALYKTPEREKFIQFSIPYRVVLSNALIIPEAQRSKFEPFINSEGAISLPRIIEKGFRIGLAKGRVYRGLIDEMLQKNKNNPNLVKHAGSHNMITNLIGMMNEGRIDAIIGYPYEAHYAAKTLKMKADIISIPIAGMDDYGLTFVGCSKTEEGKEIIKKLNAIIKIYRTTPDFLDFEEYWLDPSAVKRFRSYTIKEFGK